MMTWSTKSMPANAAALRIFSVSCPSSPDGDGSSLGWLCTRIMPDAPHSRARTSISLGPAIALVQFPWETSKKQWGVSSCTGRRIPRRVRGAGICRAWPAQHHLVRQSFPSCRSPALSPWQGCSSHPLQGQPCTRKSAFFFLLPFCFCT